MLKEGLEAVQRNLRAAMFYIGLVTAVFTAIVLLEMLLRDRLEDSQRQLFLFCRDILLAGVQAFGQSIAFARMGKEIDRPYWKVSGDRDALRRFFALWFILDLASFVSLGLIRQTGDPASQVTLLMLYVLLSGCMVPFGAAVMFLGKVSRGTLAEAPAALATQFPRLLPILFFNYAASLFILTLALSGRLPAWAHPLLVFLGGYVECVVFACTWLICRIHRDEEPEDQDFDF